MRGVSVGFMLMALLWTSPGSAQSASDRAAIEAVIGAQLQAFAHDDAERAFGYAAPGIQQQFGTADYFLTMVERGYPPVYRPRSSRFAGLKVEDGEIVETVNLIGPDGAAWTALYSMEQQPDGGWKISGCRLVKAEEVGA